MNILGYLEKKYKCNESFGPREENAEYDLYFLFKRNIFKDI